LLTVPVIQRIVGEERERLAEVVGCSLKEGMRLVGSGALNTTVLADRGNGRYGLLRPLGKGAFGYVAEIDLAEPVQSADGQDPYGPPEHAVKILIETGAQGDKHFRRFWTERTMLAAVRSGAPQVYADGVTAEGRPYFVMRYIPGMDFAAVLDTINSSIEHDETNQLRWPSQWMYLALASMSKTMHEIHYPEGAEEVVTDDERLRELGCDTVDWKERPVGLVHRDLKPSNIRIDTEGRVWIMDFGLVHHASDENQTRLTQTGQVVGTPSYMAPELIRDSKRNTTTKCDVYALGCMAFELLTGTPPFAHKEGVMQVLSAHQNEYPNFDLVQNPGARAVVQRMMHKDPAQRPDLDAVASAFHAFFLEGASEEERRQYAGFLSLPHVARKLPVPEGLMELSHLTGSDFTASGGEHSLCFTESLVTHGGDLPPDPDDNMPEVYVVGRRGKPIKLTPFVKFRRWVGRHQLVVTGTAAALLAAVLIPLGAHYSGRKPHTADNGGLVERLPTSSVSLDIDDGGRVTDIAIFDESPVQISAADIDTVRAGGATSGALFRIGADQLLTALRGQDPSLLPERMRSGGSTVGMLLLGASQEAGTVPSEKVVYVGGEEKAFFVDDGSGRVRLYTNNPTLLRARSGECAGWGGLEKAYEDKTFCTVVGAFPEVDSEEGELLNSQGKPSNSVTTVNGQVRVFREQISKHESQVTQPME
ncbi:hypothetical protein COU79_01560, partial [Candidatus Peregrinibacteria bacterium CG10_big_fil_rev_8_21_14_0_10_54_7]